MKKKIIWGIIILVLIVGGGFAYSYLSKPFILNCCHGEQYTQKGITIDEPVVNQEITFPFVVKGSISGYGWSAFEGVAGSVQVFDANNKAVSNRVPLQATGEWMQPVVHFETIVGDREMMSHITTQTGVLVFKNDNPRGEPEDDKEFRLPIKFANNQAANWKTYTNSQYGFEFKYPADWTVQTYNERADATKDNWYKPERFPFLSIVVRPNYMSEDILKVSLNDGKLNLNDKPKYCETSDTTFLGHEARKDVCAEGGEGEETYTLQLKENILISISVNSSEISDVAAVIPKSIVTSFFNSLKFTK